jgi:adenosylcobinamide amidohydrolase
MLTAAKVDRYATATQGSATAIATLGLRRPIATAAPAHPEHVDMPAETINLLAVVGVALTDAGLVNALQTAVEARAQALAAARVSAGNFDGFATGTATEAIRIACPPGKDVDYAGPATAHGQDLVRVAEEHEVDAVALA